nr:PH domain-containing protein [Sphingomonas colocasiae]
MDSGQLWVMRIHGAIAAIILIVLALAAELVVATVADGLPPPGLIAGLVVLALIYPCLIAPGRRYRAWGYRVEADELHLAHGVLTTVLTVVPFVRVQHIDVAQGPIERVFGVSRLMLHTAGTAHSLVVLPGLDSETAERLRDDIRTRIRADAA